MFIKPSAITVVNCPKCIGIEFCEACVKKYKDPWRAQFPPRYKDSCLSMAKYLSDNSSFLINNYIDKVLAKDHKDKTGLFIYGNLGIGKTWLMYAILNEIINRADLKKTTTCPAGVIDCKEMIFDFHYRYVGKGDMSITQYISGIVNFTRNGVIALDDMGHGNTTKEEFAINVFNILLDEIYTHLGFVTITSNHSPADLKSYLGSYAVDRIMDMCGNNVIELKGKSQRLM